jgi:F0F1-type ATP synthase assembly protein I
MSIVTTGIISGVTFGPPIGGLLFDIHHSVPFFFLILLIGIAMAGVIVLQRRLEASGALNSITAGPVGTLVSARMCGRASAS